MNVNKVILVGRLTRDVEMRTTNNGKTVANIGLATNSFWTNASGEKQTTTEYHNIVLFGRLAEVAGQYLSKGQEAYFEGRIQTRAYTGKDGVERKVTEVVADNMQLGSRPQGGGFSGGNAPANQGSSQPAQQKPAPQKSAIQDEDIPTINLDEEQDDIKIEDVPF